MVNSEVVQNGRIKTVADDQGIKREYHKIFGVFLKKTEIVKCAKTLEQ